MAIAGALALGSVRAVLVPAQNHNEGFMLPCRSRIAIEAQRFRKKRHATASLFLAVSLINVDDKSPSRWNFLRMVESPRI